MGPFAELSDEKKAEIRARHEARAEEENRELVCDDEFIGTLVKRGRFNGWIKPKNPGQFPEDVKKALKEMTKKQKARAKEKGTVQTFNDGVIYVRMSDVVEGVKIEP